MIFYWQNPRITQKLITSLKKNEILITTTDTIPGFLGDVTEECFKKLNKIKQDRAGKPYLILISDLSKLSHFINIKNLTPNLQKMLSTCWPGSLTIIFKAKQNLPKFLKSDEGTIAIRCPSHKPLLKILKHFKGLFSSSANISRKPSPEKIKMIDPEIIRQIKYVVDDKEQKKTESQPSTILDFSRYIKTKKIYLTRKGAYPLYKLKKIFKGITIS